MSIDSVLTLHKDIPKRVFNLCGCSFQTGSEVCGKGGAKGEGRTSTSDGNEFEKTNVKKKLQEDWGKHIAGRKRLGMKGMKTVR